MKLVRVEIMILKRYHYRPVTATAYRNSPSAIVTHRYLTVQHRYINVHHRPSPSITVHHRSSPFISVTLKNSDPKILWTNQQSHVKREQCTGHDEKDIRYKEQRNLEKTIHHICQTSFRIRHFSLEPSLKKRYRTPRKSPTQSDKNITVNQEP